MIAAADLRGTARPDAHRLLLRAVMDRLPGAGVVATSATPWASATFTGARHLIVLTLPSLAEAEGFAAAAGEMDLPIRGHIVADLVARVDEAGRLLLEALTVEDV